MEYHLNTVHYNPPSESENNENGEEKGCLNSIRHFILQRIRIFNFLVVLFIFIDFSVLEISKRNRKKIQDYLTEYGSDLNEKGGKVLKHKFKVCLSDVRVSIKTKSNTHMRRLSETTRDKFVMGYVLSKLLWFLSPPGYDVPDGATGLTPREKDIIQRTWKLVQADIKGNGVKLFLKLFERHPDYQKLFKAFADVPKDELPANGKLLGHATSVMYALNSIVDNLEDPVCLVELLHKVGSSHVPRNIKPEHFENLAEVVVVVLEEALGNSVMDTKAKEAWTKTLNVANQVIFKSLEE